MVNCRSEAAKPSGRLRMPCGSWLIRSDRFWEPTEAMEEGEEYQAESRRGDHASALSFKDTVVLATRPTGPPRRSWPNAVSCGGREPRSSHRRT